MHPPQPWRSPLGSQCRRSRHSTRTRPGLEADQKPRPNYQAPAYRAAGKLQDAVALVTGGDSGIGRAVAVRFAREGADVAIVHLPEEKRDADAIHAFTKSLARNDPSGHSVRVGWFDDSSSPAARGSRRRGG